MWGWILGLMLLCVVIAWIDDKNMRDLNMRDTQWTFTEEDEK